MPCINVLTATGSRCRKLEMTYRTATTVTPHFALTQSSEAGRLPPASRRVRQFTTGRPHVTCTVMADCDGNGNDDDDDDDDNDTTTTTTWTKWSTLVCWCVGVLVCWCVGVLVCWSVGLLLCWCVGVLALVCWCGGVVVCWCGGLLLVWWSVRDDQQASTR